MNTTGPFFLVRKVGTEFYECGTGMYAVPKLYTKGSATSLCNRRNKQEQQKYEQLANSQRPVIFEPSRFEIVPVTFILGEAT